MTPCILVGELGPNPAPLAEAVWSLARHQGLCVRAAYLLTYSRGALYFAREFLDAGRALDQLHDALGDRVLPRAEVHVQRVLDPVGGFIDDDWEPPHALAWNEARWRNALAALRAAGSDPVVFALLGGRRRSMSALDAVVFQMLAREHDRLVDVRVSDRRAEGGVGFFFPEQRDPRVPVEGGVLDARAVEVRLVDLAVPRLRRLLGERVPATYADAIARTGAAVDRTPPMLTVDLAARRVRVGDAAMPLTERQFAWYATLAWARRDGRGDGAISSDDLEPELHRTVCRMRAVDPDWLPSKGSLLKLARVGPVTPTPWPRLVANEEWSNLRSTTRRRVASFVEKLGVAGSVASLFVPVATTKHTWVKSAGAARTPKKSPKKAMGREGTHEKVSSARLPLDPSRIEIFPPA